MKTQLLIFLLVFAVFFGAAAQNKGVVQGTVRDQKTQELLPGVTVVAEGTSPLVGTQTDLDGRFRLEVPTGSYNISASFVGYQKNVKYNIVVTSGNASVLSFELSEEDKLLEEVEVVTYRALAATSLETPLSVQRLGTEEIKSNPGGNFDISRVVQSLPGVAASTGVGGFRNDIIIRGGAPNENVYYLDGIEVPIINHFATQGSAGGPTGILNVSFIEDVTLSTASFNARYDNALSSVLEFKQREGNSERLQGNVRLSGTELATTFDGPLGKNTTFLASARRSYLQLLFKTLDIPIRPNYWDFQYKVTHKFNNKTTLTLLGVGSIDEFEFAEPKESTPDKEYALRSQPAINQWHYTTGASLKRLITKGYVNIALSRNVYDNAVDRFEDKQFDNEDKRLLKTRSQEIENKLRINVNQNFGKWQVAYGLVGQYVQYTNNTFSVIRKQITDDNGAVLQPGISVNFSTDLGFFKYGAFSQVSRTFFNNRLGFSAGLRTDMNSFTNTGNNPLKTLSPRVSLSYALSNTINLNASVGRYYKIPTYTILGFRDNAQTLVNKNAAYIGSTHYVAGIEYKPTAGTRITVEGFYKRYSDYPVSVRDGISLANQGGDFNAVGNEAVTSTGEGRSYGFEVFFQQKLSKNLFAVVSYTLVNSEFSGANGKMVASAWDYRHLISALFGRKFGKGWEIGMKFRYAGGAPYTPFDLTASQLNYFSLGTGILDYNRLNTERLRAFKQFDFRADKKWNFNRFTLDLYLDVTNAFVFKSVAYPQYSFKRTQDNTGFVTTDGQPVKLDGSNAVPAILANDDPSVLPTIGFIVEF